MQATQCMNQHLTTTIFTFKIFIGNKIIVEIL
jgi:hypothetical protein